MDCPESNQLLDKVRFRLEEAARQVNLAAVNGPRIRDRMEKTWLLQERLSFKDKVSPVGGGGGCLLGYSDADLFSPAVPFAFLARLSCVVRYMWHGKDQRFQSESI